MYKLYFDGASKGNPGPSGCGGVIYDSYGDIVKEFKFNCGVGTNNRAEYLAALRGIKEAHEIGVTQLEVFGDSQLVIYQLLGTYKVRNPHLREIYNMIKEYERRFAKIKYYHVYREHNAIADRLANEGVISDKIK